jgi:hypothetical protein
MVADRSAWRASDVVAYDILRDAVGEAIATLFRLADDGVLEPNQAVREAVRIRRELLDVDADDRTAIEALRGGLEQRVAELTGRLT